MSLRACTWNLYRGHHPHRALDLLREQADTCAVREALCAAAVADPPGSLLARILSLLPVPTSADPADQGVREVLCDALVHPLSSVRRAAAARLVGDPLSADALSACLRSETSWPVRAAAGASPHLPLPVVLHALSDPHWRARMPVLKRLLQAAPLPDTPADAHPRTAGALAYLRACRDPAAPRPQPLPPAAPPPSVVWWDDDPRVVRRELLCLSPEALRESVPHLPLLLDRNDVRLRSLAVEALLRWGSTETLRVAVRGLADLRTPFVQEGLARLRERLEVERRSALAEAVFADPSASGPELAWALSCPEGAPHAPGLQSHPAPEVRAAALRFLGEESLFQAVLHDPAADVRGAAAARLGARLARVDLSGCADVPVRRGWAAAVAGEPRWWPVLVGDADARIRAAAAAELVRAGVGPGALQEDPDFRVRRAAMTAGHAERLWQAPAQETSWAVLAAAARCLQRPLSRLAPEASLTVTASPAALTPREGGGGDVAQRRLGATGLSVAPLGLSGHYGLDAAGFAEGVERGVNLLFWEPSYLQETRFLQGLPRARREALVLLTGSYDAEPRVIRRDLERSLRLLQVDQVPLFLIFWVRSRRRISPAVQEVLETAKMLGQIGSYGLSTHQRELAVEAVAEGWPLVMTRHNAAHRGAERTVFPAVDAAADPPGLITFSNLCYGRMLRDGVQAEDCYRYSLSFSAVSATLSAPGTHEELRANLAVLEQPALAAAHRARLLAAGERLYRQQQDFAHGVRWR